VNLSYRPNARNVVVYDRIRGADCRQVAVWVTNGILIGTYTSPTQGCHFKLEGLSVERIYLGQRSSDGSVNKTILKPRVALAARRQYVYVGFSQHKIPRSSAAWWQIGKAAMFLYDT